MGKTNLEGGTMQDVYQKTTRFNHQTIALGADLTLTAKHPTLLFIDPGGSARTITLPAEADAEGMMFIIFNTADMAEVISIVDDAAATITPDITFTQNEMAILCCDGTSWRGFVGVA
jgi:hypothetical protein